MIKLGLKFIPLHEVIVCTGTERLLCSALQRRLDLCEAGGKPRFTAERVRVFMIRVPVHRIREEEDIRLVFPDDLNDL